jgi:hypothetical protein
VLFSEFNNDALWLFAVLLRLLQAVRFRKLAFVGFDFFVLVVLFVCRSVLSLSFLLATRLSARRFFCGVLLLALCNLRSRLVALKFHRRFACVALRCYLFGRRSLVVDCFQSTTKVGFFEIVALLFSVCAFVALVSAQLAQYQITLCVFSILLVVKFVRIGFLASFRSASAFSRGFFLYFF